MTSAYHQTNEVNLWLMLISQPRKFPMCSVQPSNHTEAEMMQAQEPMMMKGMKRM